MWEFPCLQFRPLCWEKCHEEDWMSATLEKSQCWGSASVWQWHNVGQIYRAILDCSGIWKRRPDEKNKLSDALHFHGIQGYFPHAFQNSNIFSQIAETPDVIKRKWGSQGFKLLPMFTNEKILIRKEVEVFPFISLVADCGGILGLFLGFNFLMIWEWIFASIVFFVNRFVKI